MPHEIVFVASLERSGSTLVDLMLGCHPRFIGLGEVYRIIGLNPDGIEQLRSRNCTCGESVPACEFWGPVRTYLQQNPQLSIKKKYKAVIGVFTEIFGKNQIPVDSSKSFIPLETISSIPDFRLKVLFPIRDVRAWTVSVDDAAKKRREFKVTDILHPHGRKYWKAYLRIAIIRRLPTMYFWEWYVQNRRIKRFLEHREIPFFQFGYEELTLRTSMLVPEICRFLTVPKNDSMLSLQNSRSHVVRGNRMAFQPEKRMEISYDNRWFQRRIWAIPSLIYPHIMRYNRKQVYSNTTESK